MCWFSGPTTGSVFVSTNQDGCTVELLADLVLRGQLAISDVDPSCRTEIEELVITAARSELARQ